MVGRELIEKRTSLYTQLWGREPDFVRHPTSSEVPHVSVYRFPKVQHECPMSFRYVYMTAGMSDVEMAVPTRLAKSIPSRIEISAYSDEIITTNGGKGDFICEILHWLAHHAFRESTFLAATQTFQVGQPIIPGSEMSAYYFAETPIVSGEQLFKHTPKAEGFVHLVPISEAERLLAINEGSKSLLRLFHEKGIHPDFNLTRKSAI